MKTYEKYLQLAKSTAINTANNLYENHKFLTNETKSLLNGKEVKYVADQVFNEAILSQLRETNFKILSEETGLLNIDSDEEELWIVDPLDGSINYSKGIGPSAISIALWDQEANSPIFGVIWDLTSKTISWGGKALGGSWSGGWSINVSDVDQTEKGVLFTGLPARFDFNDEIAVNRFTKLISKFRKVRMIGAASMSLLQVGKGNADAYYEDKIMIWDVAAGIAIVEGAGGHVEYTPQGEEFSYTVKASNLALKDKF